MISAFIKTCDDKIGGKDKIWNQPTDVGPGRSKCLRKSDFRTMAEKSFFLFGLISHHQGQHFVELIDVGLFFFFTAAIRIKWIIQTPYPRLFPVAYLHIR